MNTKIFHTMQLILLSCVLCAGCKKQDEFLNKKPVKSLSVLSTLQDVQLLLQNEDVFNSNDPALGEIASDDFYVTDETYTSLYTTQEQKGYIWQKTIYDAGVDVADWTLPYNQVYYSNVVLDALPKIPRAGQEALYDQCRGAALFFRSYALYNLLQTFSKPFDSATADKDLGVVLRLNSDLNIKPTRSTISTCYAQVLSDLETASDLLPERTPFPTQPSRNAVDGLLARIYLAMGDYNNAFAYSDALLKSRSALVDYNTIVPTDYSLSTSFLTEDLFHSYLNAYAIVSVNYQSMISKELYDSYNDNDLRKTAFFILNDNIPFFRGTYDPKGNTFSGIATDEIFLIRAEANIRLGRIEKGLNDLNALLVTRWKTGTFLPVTAVSAADALTKVLTERRKELLYRGTRWTDLRRLNKENNLEVTLSRIVAGVTYSLPPNDNRYTMPIPDNEISLSGIQQNKR